MSSLLRKRESPAWKNPRERMTKHMKRKSSSRCLNASLNSSAMMEDINTESCPPAMSTPPSVARNPFKKLSPQKKKVKLTESEDLKELPFDWDDTTANDSFSSTGRNPISHPNVKKIKLQSMLRSQSMGSPHSATDFSDMYDMFSANTSVTTEPEEAPGRASTEIPLDLRLGTKLRIASPKPFPWMTNVNTTGVSLVRLTGAEKHEGMKSFLDHSETTEKSRLPFVSHAASLVEGASLYWQYPSQPWISLFPRLDQLLKTLPKRVAPPLAPSMIDVLNKQWVECFEQLYLSWKKGDRHRFYVACPTFTVLFTKSNSVEDQDVGDDSTSCFHTTDGSRHIAIITPTNVGFRRYLLEEGVEFELCSFKKRRLSKISLKMDDSTEGDISLMSDSNDTSITSIDKQKRVSFEMGGKAPESPEEKEKENSAASGESDENDSPSKKHNAGDHDWLREMGVSPRNTLKLRKYKSMSCAIPVSVSEKKADKDETSAVVIKGSFVQALYNLLQTSRVCRAIAGPHANLPPTLLAAKPFLHGQMMSLKKSSQTVKRVGHSMEYVLELDGGPILPHSVELAVDFIRSAGLCDESPVQLRVNDRQTCAGFNGTEKAEEEWSELTVRQNDVTW